MKVEKKILWNILPIFIFLNLQIYCCFEIKSILILVTNVENCKIGIYSTVCHICTSTAAQYNYCKKFTSKLLWDFLNFQILTMTCYFYFFYAETVGVFSSLTSYLCLLSISQWSYLIASRLVSQSYSSLAFSLKDTNTRCRGLFSVFGIDQQFLLSVQWRLAPLAILTWVSIVKN